MKGSEILKWFEKNENGELRGEDGRRLFLDAAGNVTDQYGSKYYMNAKIDEEIIIACLGELGE